MTVLYAEDHPTNVRLVERLTERRGGVELHVCPTGRDALAAAARLRPDLVLLDLHLPDLPGEVVLERLWALPGLAGLPVAVLSADALPATVARLLAAGVGDYLTKPLDVARFYACLDAVQAASPLRERAC